MAENVYVYTNISHSIGNHSTGKPRHCKWILWISSMLLKIFYRSLTLYIWNVIIRCWMENSPDSHEMRGSIHLMDDISVFFCLWSNLYYSLFITSTKSLSPQFLIWVFRQKDGYSELRQKSKMELFAKIIHSFRGLTIFVKSSILDAGLGSEYTSADKNPLLIF